MKKHQLSHRRVIKSARPHDRQPLKAERIPAASAPSSHLHPPRENSKFARSTAQAENVCPSAPVFPTCTRNALYRPRGVGFRARLYLHNAPSSPAGPSFGTLSHSPFLSSAQITPNFFLCACARLHPRLPPWRFLRGRGRGPFPRYCRAFYKGLLFVLHRRDEVWLPRLPLYFKDCAAEFISAFKGRARALSNLHRLGFEMYRFDG